MKWQLLLTILLFTSLTAYSQNVPVDSLENIVSNSKNKLELIKAKIRLANYYGRSDTSLTFQYLNEAISESTGYHDSLNIIARIDLVDFSRLLNTDLNRLISDLEKMLHEKPVQNELALRSKILMLKATLLFQTGELEEARVHFEQCQDYYRDNRNDQPRAFAVCMFYTGVTYKNLQEYVNAIEIFHELGEFCSSEDLASIAAAAFNNLGALFAQIDDLERSEEYYKRAVDVTTPADYNYAHLVRNYADALISSRKPDSSLHWFRKVMHNKNTRAINTISIFGSMSEAFSQTGQYDSAQYYISLAKNLMREKDIKNITHNIIGQEGVLEYERNQFPKSFRLFEQSIDSLHRYGENTEITNLMIIYGLYFKSFAKQDSNLKFNKYLIDFIDKMDSLADQKIENRIIQLEYQYQTEKKVSENNQLKAEKALKDATISRQKDILIGSLIGLLFISVLSVLLYRQNRKRIKVNLELRKQKDQIQLLNRELNHRVKNNLAFMTSLLEMQLRRSESEEAKAVLRESESRLNALSLVHSNLFRNKQNTRINLQSYLEEITQHLQDIFEIPGKSLLLDTSFVDYVMDAEDAMRVGLIVNELVTNSVKHAFHDVSQPRVNITTALNSQDQLILHYEDNGPGVTDHVLTSAVESESLGRKLIDLLVKQLNGMMKMEGARVDVVFG